MNMRQYGRYFQKFKEMEQQVCKEYELVKIPLPVERAILSRSRDIARARAEYIMESEDIAIRTSENDRMECLVREWETEYVDVSEKYVVVIMGFAAYAGMVMEEYSFMTDELEEWCQYA